MHLPVSFSTGNVKHLDLCHPLTAKKKQAVYIGQKFIKCVQVVLFKKLVTLSALKSLTGDRGDEAAAGILLASCRQGRTSYFRQIYNFTGKGYDIMTQIYISMVINSISSLYTTDTL